MATTEEEKKKPATGSTTTKPLESKKGEYIIEPNKKYDYVHKLNATQTAPSELKTTNFKQDYVVIIRKKPYYASTSQQRLDENGQPMKDRFGNVILPEENYLRVYQVNNFTNVRVSTGVSGRRPGTANITVRGGERVICAEKSDQDKFGWVDWNEMLNGWLSINETATEGSSGGKVSQERIREGAIAGLTEGAMKSTNGKKWTVGEANWANQNAAGVDFKNLAKTREAKYGWRFAEKADWEPMDEVWIFGKSRSARQNDETPDDSKRDKDGMLSAYSNNAKNPNKGEYKFLPLFFGYIDNVTKTFTANKGGLLISITARDHTKLLDLSRIVNSPTLVPGITSGGGIDIRYNKTAFGSFDLNQPLADQKGVQKSVLQERGDLKQYFLQNIFAGVYPYDIIQVLGAQAGIPDKYLTSRIEHIKQIPFVYKIKQQNGDLFNGEMKTRLSICNEAADKLFLEFFADEEGNLVLKIPNYALGVNRIDANNCGIKYPSTLLSEVYGTFKTTTAATTTTTAAATTDTSGQPDANANSAAEQQAADKQQAISDAQAAVTQAQSENDQAYQAASQADAQAQETQSTIDANNLQSGQLRVEGKTEEADALDAQTSQLTQTLATQKAEAQAAHEASQAAVSKLAQAQTDLANAQGTAASGADFNFDAEAVLAENNIKEVIVDEFGTGEHGSLYDIAKKYLGDGTRWTEIAIANDIIDPTTVKAGDKINVHINDANISAKTEVAASKAAKPSIGDAITSGVKKTFDSIGNTLKSIGNAFKPPVKLPTRATKEVGTSVKNTEGKTLSERTDMDIPAIKAEFVVSFTLIDSDNEIYNMFEIGGESLMGVQDAGKGQVMTQIRRAIPDIDSITRFGLRPHPGIINTPLVSNVFEAELMGLMMLMKSQANRYSGSITVIDDSAVKVGNPIRIHMYDEHPHKEITIDRTAMPSENETNFMFDKTRFPEQAVFYVTGIERNIDPTNVSYMTLQVKAGRMMGQTSIYDICLPLYEFYFDEMLTVDITKSLKEYIDFYKSNHNDYVITANDSFETILKNKYQCTANDNPAKALEIFNAMISLNPTLFGIAAQMPSSTQMNLAIAAAVGKTILIPVYTGRDTALIIAQKQKEEREKQEAASKKNPPDNASKTT